MFYTQSQVDRIQREHDKNIKTLEDLNADLKSQLEKERERAENAIDQIILMKGGSPVTPLKTKNETKKMIDQVIKNFNTVGEEINDGAE